MELITITNYRRRYPYSKGYFQPDRSPRFQKGDMVQATTGLQWIDGRPLKIVDVLWDEFIARWIVQVPGFSGSEWNFKKIEESENNLLTTN